LKSQKIYKNFLHAIYLLHTNAKKETWFTKFFYHIYSSILLIYPYFLSILILFYLFPFYFFPYIFEPFSFYFYSLIFLYLSIFHVSYLPSYIPFFASLQSSFFLHCYSSLLFFFLFPHKKS